MTQEHSNNRLALVKEIPMKKDQWFSKYKQVTRSEPHHVLLESGRGGRYSIIGLRPFAILEGKDKQLTVTSKQGVTKQTGELLSLMREWMEQYDVKYQANGPPFQGGAIGYFSYDIVREIENLPIQTEDDLRLHDLYFLVFDTVYVFDHEKEHLSLCTFYVDGEQEEARKRLEEAKSVWEAEVSAWTWEQVGNVDVESWETSLSEEEFGQAVEKIKDYIANGDVFQVNLSVRQAKNLKTEALHIYEKLRELNPSPYMAYLHSPEFQLVSGSPELLVKKVGEEVSTRPIAGTRSRGKDEQEDERLAKTLMENEKERAEHIMLVDLERNDLGRVCQFGTVEVNELMVIEKYSHVMHIVSNVRGKIAPDKDVYDIIKATFPGGTITGAPKVRTMEIIEELEPVRRGVYTGSIGWVGFNGDMELNIVIRTLLAKNGMAYVQAGAGIVIDSSPKAEFKESLKKAKALWRAKEMSEEEVFKEEAKLS